MKFTAKEIGWIKKNTSSKDIEDVRRFLKPSKANKPKKKTKQKDFVFKNNTKVEASTTEDWIKNTRIQLLSKCTKYETELYILLEILGIEFEKQKPILSNGRIYFADAFLPNSNAIIELDGLYHRGENQRKKDILRDKNLSNSGFAVIHIVNDRIFDRVEVVEYLRKRLNLSIDARLYID